MPALVDIAAVTYAYRRGGAPALHQVNLQVDRGTTVGLIGPNGGGKTTLVKLLLGLLVPTAGTITIDGLTPAKAVRRGDVMGYLPQKTPRPDRLPLTVRQVVRMGLAGKTGIGRSTPPDDLAYADGLIDRVGIGDLADRLVADLSGGQLQRVLIARALAPRPKLLLLDEPTTGIDAAGQRQFVTFLQAIQRELGLTVILVSHDLRAVCAMSDRIACLSGTLHYHDVPERLPADLVYRMFACDLQAMGIAGQHKGCGDPACDHGAAAAVTGARAPPVVEAS
jgi:zinc transport system ATP-binding protein